MVVMAAAVFFKDGILVTSIEAARHALAPVLGKFAGVAFAAALLWSGFSSATGGTMVGHVILQGFLNFRINVFLRGIVTMIPTIAVIALGLDPLKTLGLSQAVLSFCLPFAMTPLFLLSRRTDLMGTYVNRPVTSYLAALVILVMNARLLYAIATGRS
jgi:manganese transport protein